MPDFEKTRFQTHEIIYNIHLSSNIWRCDMNSYGELKVELDKIQQQIVEAKKNELVNTLKKVNCLCKDFGFTAGMLKGALAEERNKS